MKISFAVLLLITFTAVGYGQTQKIFAENVRDTEKIVKGAPFSAEAVSESIQILTDGNKIIRRTTSRMYRDNEGRFRREDMPKQLGVPGAIIEMPESVFILDPVAGYRYELNSKKNTARQFVFRTSYDFKPRPEPMFKAKIETKQVEKEVRETGKDTNETGTLNAEQIAKRKEEMAKRAEQLKARQAARKEELEKRTQEIKARVNANPSSSDGKTKTESLGVQNIEGVNAEGTRTTTTIPAGSIGNEREIDVVYEKWYSKELQMTVLSKHNDPRFGEQTYRLTNISRTEPPISLFSPPADYTIINARHPQPKPVPQASKPPSFSNKPAAAATSNKPGH